MSNQPTDDIPPIIDWDAIVDDDPIVAEVRRIRYEILAEFDFDSTRHHLGGEVLAWACGDKFGDPHNPQAPPKEAELPELPADLSGLIPNREQFVEYVRDSRRFYAKHEPDLDAYNEDARHRARVLGFPEDAFVVAPSDFPPDFDLWEELEREDDMPVSATSSATPESEAGREPRLSANPNRS